MTLCRKLPSENRMKRSAPLSTPAGLAATPAGMAISSLAIRWPQELHEFVRHGTKRWNLRLISADNMGGINALVMILHNLMQSRMAVYGLEAGVITDRACENQIFWKRRVGKFR